VAEIDQPNMFRRARKLLLVKTGGEMTEEELETVSLAVMFVANELPKAFPEVATILDGLLLLAEIVEDNKARIERIVV